MIKRTDDKELTYDELEMIETQIEELKEKKKKIEEERRLIKEKEKEKRWKEVENAYNNWAELLSKYEEDFSFFILCSLFLNQNMKKIILIAKILFFQKFFVKNI